MQAEDHTRSGDEIRRFIPAERVKDRLIDRVSFASDAGFYRLIPEAVVFPEGEEEIRQLFSWCNRLRKPLVFRAGGSSLSGQAITDGILCDLSRSWKKCRPEEKGSRVRVEPGITGAMVNARLKSFGRKIGPDPSSISAAMMGGILSNNASGMCCGVKHNSYHTTRSLRFILPDGNTYSTENNGDYERFLRESSQLAGCLLSLKAQIEASPELCSKIRNKYRSKNTVGYSLNAFLDFEHPLDIFSRLLIGAEGTLAFIAEAVLETIPDHPHKATGLLFFPDVETACAAVALLNETGAEMVELMDRASMQAVENKAGMPEEMKTLGAEAAALLVEFQAADELSLAKLLRSFEEKSGQWKADIKPAFTMDADQRDKLWKVRKGLFPAVGAVRKSGTSVILEDLAFPLENLGPAVKELRQLFRDFGYDDGIIFGHAKDGNLHFVISQSFGNEKEIRRYGDFMDAVVTMVLRLGGSLKAEHGTGRNMAPFVESEWGSEALLIMQKLKAAADPQGILNPGVILNPDPKAHLKNLKPLPAVEEEADRCIECGFCEHTCPSRELSSSPRRRIVIRRALREMEEKGDHSSAELLLRNHEYEVNDTCAVDGLCAAACPVDINTGELVKRLRRENHSVTANAIAMEIARNFALAEWAAGNFIRAGRLGGSFSRWMSRGLRTLSGTFPHWPASVPAPAVRKESRASSKNPSFLYFPSCINRSMGGFSSGQGNAIDAFLRICRESGIPLQEIRAEGLCCSQVFSSKGFSEAARFMAEKVCAILWESSRGGEIPVVCDVSSCTYTFRNLGPALGRKWQSRYRQIRFVDMVDVLHDHVLPLLPQVKKQEKMLMHPVCSLQKMNSSHKLLAIGKHFAEEVSEVLNGGCCGMAGDRGFFFPELTASSAQASAIAMDTDEKIYSCTATCELALRENLKRDTMSVLELIASALKKETIIEKT